MAAASKGTDQFIHLLNAKTAVRFGFPDGIPSRDDVTPLAPLPESIVDLSTLKGYAKGGNAAAVRLIQPLDKWVVPLMVNSNIRSSVTVVKDPTGWKVTAFNAASRINELVRIRAVAGLNSALRGAKYSIVSVTGLNLQFIGAQLPPPRRPLPRPGSPRILPAPGQFYFLPIITSKRLGITAGVPVLAQDLFVSLSTDAAAYNGLPT